MRDINFFDIKGNKITADLIFSLNVSASYIDIYLN